VSARVKSRPVGHPRGLAETNPAVLAPPEVHEDTTTLVVARIDGAVAVVAAVHLGEGTRGGVSRYRSLSESGPSLGTKTGARRPSASDIPP
jgi:hypothetical protein